MLQYKLRWHTTRFWDNLQWVASMSKDKNEHKEDTQNWLWLHIRDGNKP
jgi:hypothetical protein